MSTRSSAPVCAIPPVRAVSLGGWLVAEEWVTPSLFDCIPNRDLSDETLWHLKSVTRKKYLSAKDGGGHEIVADKIRACGSETFQVESIGGSSINLRVSNTPYYVGRSKDDQITIVAVEMVATDTEKFDRVFRPGDPKLVRFKASNGKFVQVKEEKLVTADYDESEVVNDWEDNPSVFSKILSGIGDYQLTKSCGPLRAPQVMKKHWNTFIVEDDFKFIKDNGLDAVKIPVGWWTAYDPNPPEPYVTGSLQALDNAFSWAEKYDIKVIIDLRAAPGLQSGADNEGHIQATVKVIEFFAARYAKNPSLLAVGLLNDPYSPLAHQDVLIHFYRRGYDAVRRHSPTAYVLLRNHLGTECLRELLCLAQELPKSVIDVHYYNLFDPKFDKLTVQENIDFVKKDRANELKELTKPNGSLVFVGEWVAEWQAKDATKEDYQKFAQAQLQVYSGATFGWSYSTLKNVSNHWSLEWMIKNGYMLPPL